MGAVFSGSNENYECSAANAFSRMALVSGINSDRAGNLLVMTKLQIQNAKKNINILSKVLTK